MKIYIVTSGDYSDYHIDKVFVDKEKAKKYIEYHNKYVGEYGDEYSIEDWDTEDKEFESIYNIWFSFRDKPIFNSQFIYSIDSTTTADVNLNDFSAIVSFDNWNGSYNLHIEQTLKIDIGDMIEFRNKYEKVCQDLMAQIKSLIDVENWTVDMVNDWLKEKYKGYNMVA